MRRSNYEIAGEILHRATMLDQRDAKGKKLAYMALAASACLLLVVGLSFIMPSVLREPASPDAVWLYSATLLGDGSVGGYVLMGVLGFALGAVVMYLSLSGARRDDEKDDDATRPR